MKRETDPSYVVPPGLWRVIGIGAALYFFGTMAVAGMMLTTAGG